MNQEINTSTTDPLDHQALRARIETLLTQLCQGLYEREDAVRLALLSALAGESIFLLGPPGVGKSLIARRLKHAFRDGISFEYLMSKFSTPDEIFGPVSIQKLKEEDKYQRLTENYLPSANIVFLDEIWKAGPSIQNALLTILNEKVYKNGEEEMKVNIRGIITASNELPPQGGNLAPIWDRFLLRLELGNIRKAKNFLNMITDSADPYVDNINNEVKIKNEEIDFWMEEIDKIELPAEVLNTIQIVKLRIDEHNAQANNAANPILLYDRRWKKLVQLMRTSAFLNGRTKVDLMDCFLMEHCLWNAPDQKEFIQEFVAEAVRKHGYTLSVNLGMLKKEVSEFEQDVEDETRVKYTQAELFPMVVQEYYYELDKKEQQFNGQLVQIKQFNALELDDEQVVNFYDEELNLVNRLKALKSPTEHTIDVFHNSIRHSIPLITQQRERSEIVYKKPHKVLEKFWDERYHKLWDYVEEQEKRLETEAPSALNHLKDNLFVETELAGIVTANLEEVQKALGGLKLRLEKLKYDYTNL